MRRSYKKDNRNNEKRALPYSATSQSKTVFLASKTVGFMKVETSKRIEAKTWEDLWKRAEVAEWDELSEAVHQILKKVIVGTKGKLILEAGSGTGRISFKLREEDVGNTVLLDISKAAIEISKKFFKERDQTGFFVRGSIFNIPVKDESVDIVWNAGVLEHFLDRERVLALREMTRVCKKKGFIITLNPYSRAIFYRAGKWIAEKRRKWVYGYEQPIKSMTKYAVENCIWIAEYSTDFDTSIRFVSNIPYLRYLIPLLRGLCKKLPTYISNHLGYLKVSIAVKAKCSPKKSISTSGARKRVSYLQEE